MAGSGARRQESASAQKLEGQVAHWQRLSKSKHRSYAEALEKQRMREAEALARQEQALAELAEADKEHAKAVWPAPERRAAAPRGRPL